MSSTEKFWIGFWCITAVVATCLIGGGMIYAYKDNALFVNKGYDRRMVCDQWRWAWTNNTNKVVK